MGSLALRFSFDPVEWPRGFALYSDPTPPFRHTVAHNRAKCFGSFFLSLKTRCSRVSDVSRITFTNTLLWCWYFNLRTTRITSESRPELPTLWITGRSVAETGDHVTDSVATSATLTLLRFCIEPRPDILPRLFV